MSSFTDPFAPAATAAAADSSSLSITPSSPSSPSSLGPLASSKPPSRSPVSPMSTDSLHGPTSTRAASLADAIASSERPGPAGGGAVGGAAPGAGLGGITFISPFASTSKRGSIVPTTITVASGRRPSTPGSPSTRGGAKRPSVGRSSSHGRSISSSDSPLLPPPSRRASMQDTPSPMCSPAGGGTPASPFFTNLSAEGGLLKPTPDFYRRRSVDVGVLGVGNHRMYGATVMSKRLRHAIGPDAGDKETGVIGAGAKGGRDRLLGRYLASLLAHSLALCAAHKADDGSTATPYSEETESAAPTHRLESIPASPVASPATSRNTSVSTESNLGPPPASTAPTSPFGEGMPVTPLTDRRPSLTFPIISSTDRIKLVGSLQSWSFDALSLSADELLACMGLIFESLRSMEGVDFDLDRLRALLLSLRSAYHDRNGYHNFKHAADVTQACYSFLLRMGLVPPLYLLCEEDHHVGAGSSRRKWRRNRAVEQSPIGQLLRPADVFALMVACIGHDVGHPGLTNAYMVNARAPVAQVYDDKSILENFHTVTLIHMLRKFHFDEFLGGDFGCLGAAATPFRRVLESSILATDMSRHFAFVTDLTEMKKRNDAGLTRTEDELEADRLLLCAGLIKCADISNPTRPHRISRSWAAALQAEWAVQASIEAGFGLPVTVITQDPSDAKAQAKGQVGFIDLFCKPLFAAMAGVVEEFGEFVDKLDAGRLAWDGFASQTDQAFSRPLARDFALPLKPPPRRANSSQRAPEPSKTSLDTPTRSVPIASVDGATGSGVATVPASPTRAPATPIDIRRARPVPLRMQGPRSLHGRQASNTSSISTSASPLSPSFFDSASSATTNFSAFSLSQHSGSLTADSVTLMRYSNVDPLGGGLLSTSAERAQRSICGGACMLGTAMCEVCAAAQRRGSLDNALDGVVRQLEDDDHEEEEEDEELHLLDAAEEANLWPPHPFQVFAELVHALGAAKPTHAGRSRTAEQERTLKTLKTFIEQGKEALQRQDDDVDGLVVLFFRLFFPDEGVRRRYDLREQKLARILARLLGVREDKFDSCLATSATGVVEHFGCLGEQVRVCMEENCYRFEGSNGQAGEITFGHVDRLLDELAAASPWSSREVRDLRLGTGSAQRTQDAILLDLLRNLAPSEVSVMIQIILRDLWPLLYPPPSPNPTASLLNYNSAAYKVIAVEDVLQLWAPGARGLYRAVADLDWVAWRLDNHLRTRDSLPPAMPRIGLPVKVPKSQRPGTCKAATKHLRGLVAVETKYDGERVQLHVDLSLPADRQIKIFSKSGRDSTLDRKRLIPVIKAALGLRHDPSEDETDTTLAEYRKSALFARIPHQKLILEGEMVPFDEETQSIAEFWRLRFAKLDTADYEDEYGRQPPFFTEHAGVAAASYETGQTGVTPSPARSGTSTFGAEAKEAGSSRSERGLHLMMVWFDCLRLDDRSLMEESYKERRSILRQVVTDIPGYSMLADQLVIDFDDRASALNRLRKRFAQIITDRCEGLMLKPLPSVYNASRKGSRWIKLKKDFIPGAGDTLDFHLVGASYDMKRARELLVPPSVLTTFFVGVLAPSHGIVPFRTQKKHFHILFSVSYGLSRDQLAFFNSSLRQEPLDRFEYPAARCPDSPFDCIGMSGPKDEYPVYNGASTTFTFSLATHLRGNAVRPHLIFRRPRIAELNGAGFQRSFGSPYYELRWPRFTKFDRPDGAGEPQTLPDLQTVAQAAVQVERPGVDLVEQLFAIHMDGAGSEVERDRRGGGRAASERALWLRRLEEADGIQRPPSRSMPSLRRVGIGLDAAIIAMPNAKLSTADTLPVATASTTLPVAVSTTDRATSPGQERDDKYQLSTPFRFSSSNVLQGAAPACSWPASPMKRSFSSPAHRSDAPSPSQHGPDGTSLPRSGAHRELELVRASRSDNLLDRRKRRRTLQADGQVDRPLGSSATMPILLPSVRQLRDELATPPGSPADGLFATASSTWTIFPRTSSAPQRTPRHAALDWSNYVQSPWRVLRAAGHAVSGDSGQAGTPFESLPIHPQRFGYIFVADGVDEKAFLRWFREQKILSRKKEAERRRSGLAQSSPDPKPVFLLRMTAFDQGFSFASAHIRHDILDTM
ncbi:hypothetical protein JCM10908_000545 [Rhodotorula pacifica]|uniref:3',5'-cyclic-nucleotide phosphodiesterase PDE2 n=1 Tax=Rhodotorula pacifica TaxID=1495444 RepID=UPI00317AFA12